jgi:hypothetical protein
MSIVLTALGCSQGSKSDLTVQGATEEVATACCPEECDFDADRVAQLQREADSGDIAALGLLQTHYGSLCNDQPGPKYFELLEEGVRRSDATSEINLAVELMNDGGEDNCRRARDLLQTLQSRVTASKEDRESATSWLEELGSKQQCLAVQTGQ